MSDVFGPFSVRPGLLQRSTDFMDLITRHRPGTSGLRLWMADTIEDAYGTLVGSGLAGAGGSIVLTAQSGGIAQSPRVVRRGWRVEENRKGHTSFQFDPADGGSGGISFSDDMVLFARVQEQRGGTWLTVTGPVNNGYNVRGPILFVPPATLMSVAASVISLQANAPLATGCTAGAAPVVDLTIQTPVPLHIVFPIPAATVTLKNLSAGDDLLVSYGLGLPMMVVAAGDTTVPTGGGYTQPGVREIVVAADPTAAAVVPFSIEATIGRTP